MFEYCVHWMSSQCFHFITPENTSVFKVYKMQKQPSRCDLGKRCSGLQLYWNCTSAWVFSCKFPAYFKSTFSSEHLWTAVSENGNIGQKWVNYLNIRSCHQRCPIKKGILKNFAKFTGKHQWQSLFLNKVAGLRPVTHSFSSICQ